VALRWCEREGNYPYMDSCVNQIWMLGRTIFKKDEKKPARGGVMWSARV